MRVQFTKRIMNGRDSMKNAINERINNLDLDKLSDDEKKLLQRLQDPNYFFSHTEDYKLLSEMAAQTNKLWNSGRVLNLYFFGGQDERTRRVLEYASIWSEYCSIKFEATEEIKEAQIRVSFKDPSSWSYLGTDALGVPENDATVNFGWLDDSLPEKDYKQVILHEFGHILGLIHEHQSPSVKIDWNKRHVYWYFREHYGWSQEKVDKNVFLEFETTSTQYSTLDKLSIMGYHIPPQFTNNGQEFPLNYDLSDMDKQYIGKLYPQLLYS